MTDVLYIGHVSNTQNRVLAYRMDSDYAEETADMLVNMAARGETPSLAATGVGVSDYSLEKYHARFKDVEEIEVSTDLALTEGDILSPDVLEPGAS